jgi:hypothetical protein
LKELAYLAANANAQHLLVTTADNGLDWSVSTRTGAVTAYNALYYRALTGAAAMVQAPRQDQRCGQPRNAGRLGEGGCQRHSV